MGADQWNHLSQYEFAPHLPEISVSANVKYGFLHSWWSNFDENLYFSLLQSSGVRNHQSFVAEMNKHSASF
jgi:hypothetical protein